MKKSWYNVCCKLGVIGLAVIAGGCQYIEQGVEQGKAVLCRGWKYVAQAKLDDPAPTQINAIVEKHKAKINREDELKLLCGKAWVPVYIKGQEGVDGKNAIVLPANLQAFIEFHRDGKVNGFAGVNNFSGHFAVTAPNMLRFGALATTLMAGPHVDYEMLFMAQINEVSNFSFTKDGMLELKKRNMLMMRCKAVSPKSLKRKTQAKTSTPIPPEPATRIAPKADGKNKAAVRGNPAMPTVEKAPAAK